ncbi:MAG TPA: alkaline phosphatase D family protein, partial [Actinomycetota bacterium]|nr:alkaline phosphatase D family protein [Actinomycetota bacterium]
MASLVLGPLLRYVGEAQATVWVETDTPCEVEVLGHRSATFHVEGHHYALVVVEGLEPGRAYAYQVRLDGGLAWPEPGSRFPPSSIRTLDPAGRGRPLKLVFGSCRVAAPHEPPYTLPRAADKRGREVDALRTYALRMLAEPPEAWPHALFMLGDQVYADDTSPGTREFIRSRRDTSQPPGEEVADFEEYTHLYLESWGEPVLRWLLSTVPSAMIFDDHDVHDDWNTSAAWVASMRAEPWWQERIESALASYWLYQHLGNLAPAELAGDPLYAKVQAAGDGGPVLRELAARADREAEGTRWSYHRDFGTTRLLVVDSRCGRVLDGSRREMLDPAEWRWVEEGMTGEFDHLLVATSLPFLLAPGTHHLEAWNEAVCAGAWGRAMAKLGEQLRQAADLEHWAAFGSSFERLARLLLEVASGRRGPAPASVVLLSGDVHHAYLA